DRGVRRAALVPIESLLPIWISQRDISQRLISEGRLGRITKNHALNGQTPTIYLHDDRGGQEVADALWSYEGVVDLVSLAPVPLLPEDAEKGDGTKSDFVPVDGDRRELVQRQIKERRGQQAFRDALRAR